MNEWGKEEDLSNETRLREEEAIEGWGWVEMNTIQLEVGERKSSRSLIFIRDFLLLLVFSVLKFDSNCCFIQSDFLNRKKERFRTVSDF